MSHYIIFDATSGIINRQIECPSSMIAANVKVGEDYIEQPEVDDAIEKVDTITRLPVGKPANTVVSNKLQVVADGVDAVTLSSVPNPSVVLVRGIMRRQRVDVTDGTLVWTTDLPGSYTISVKSPGYLEKEFAINALVPV